MKTRRSIPRDTKGIFWPLVSLKSMWKLWKSFLSSDLNCRLLKAWKVMHCPVVLKSLAHRFEIRGSNAEMELLCRQKWCTQTSLYITWERVHVDNVVSKLNFVRFFSSHQHSKLNAHITSENVSQVRTKECKTRSGIRKLNLLKFWVLRDTVMVIQHPLWLCLPWMRVFMGSFLSVMEG